VFWLVTMLASLGVGGFSVFVTLNRLGGDSERAFRKAPELPPAKFAEGAYGRITGVASSTEKLPMVPGLDRPCLLYELTVYESTSDRNAGMGWRVVHRELVGADLEVTVEDTVIRVSARDLYLFTAPSHDANEDLRARPRPGSHTSRVRFVLPGATVHVVGTLTREVDDAPAAARDYRSIATRYRLIGKRDQPIVLAAP
jgi:hypothetical protein